MLFPLACSIAASPETATANNNRPLNLLSFPRESQVTGRKYSEQDFFYGRQIIIAPPHNPEKTR
jgi:hypothetical protein